MADDKPAVPAHPLSPLRRHTEARIGLGRFGAGLPTAAHLDFAEAHAKARDAVHTAFDVDDVAERLSRQGLPSVRVRSEVPDRATYLRRPDLGRRLAEDSRVELAAIKEGPFDLVIVIADGLSARAVNLYAAETAAAVVQHLPADWRFAPVVIAEQGRVALSDPIGEALRAEAALMLIGERPGLSASDSLGAYLTHAPKPGRSDAERNCVSNIRAGGFKPDLAAAKIADLAMRAKVQQISGVRLREAPNSLAEGGKPD
ncbi:ethanolamine ammonia-lyase subunit EutC [Consotaella aegiceratis]|uniref:ethanolamine ammonia-lyase subunit EutC n=1 Tax=Consotaella aegiceratis TaxID=3097961 RepID=UPI002F40185A